MDSIKKILHRWSIVVKCDIDINGQGQNGFDTLATFYEDIKI